MIRDAARGDFEAILALNLAFERYLSPLDAGRLARLDAMAFHHRVAVVAGEVAAFVLAFAPAAAYDSENYRWFDARYGDFLYVDRVVVGAEHQGRSLGVALYADLFARARAAGFGHVACEFDVRPPNERSRRFHERLGFVEVGSQRVGASGKRVSLQRVPVDPCDEP